MNSFNPLLYGDFLRNMNVLGVSHECSKAQLWIAAQNYTIFWSQYCVDRGLPIEAVAAVFGVTRHCDNHCEAALYGAANLVECFLTPDIIEGGAS